MGKWTDPIQMVNGAEDGVYSAVVPPAIKWGLGVLAGVLVGVFLAVLGFGGWLVIQQIALGRELSNLSGDIRTIHVENSMRGERRSEEHDELVAADRYAIERIDQLEATLKAQAKHSEATAIELGYLRRTLENYSAFKREEQR